MTSAITLKYLKLLQNAIQLQRNGKECEQKLDDKIMDNNDHSVNMNAGNTFRTQSFYVIIDRLMTEMERRRAAYPTLHERFNFLLDRSLPSAEIISKAKALVEVYPSDLEQAFANEFLLLSRLNARKKI